MRACLKFRRFPSWYSRGHGDLRGHNPILALDIKLSIVRGRNGSELGDVQPADRRQQDRNLDGRCLEGKREKCRDTQEGEGHQIIPSELLFEKENREYDED